MYSHVGAGSHEHNMHDIHLLPLHPPAPYCLGLTTRMANKVARFCLYLGLRFMLRGCPVSYEDPPFSYLWLLEEFRGVAGLECIHLVRADYCMCGTPCQKAGCFLSNNPYLNLVACVCIRPRPHPARLTGQQTRKSAPYPRQLCLRMVEAMAMCVCVCVSGRACSGEGTRCHGQGRARVSRRCS